VALVITMVREKKKKLESNHNNKNNGLKITFDKEDMRIYLPNLIEEISNQKKSIKIDSVNYEIEKNNDKKKIKRNSYKSEELINPTALDFIRRCSNDQQALEILDYLLRRKEISQDDYNSYKQKIEKEGGLDKLIKESGGFKKSGYYLKKFYYKDLKPNNKLEKSPN